MDNVSRVQEEIFNEINDPQSKIMFKVQKKQLNREGYLEDIKKRCLREGLNEDEAEDIVFLVNKALWGFGILDDLINNEDISDIRLTNKNNIRIKKLGERLNANVKFTSDDEYRKYIEFITNRNSTNISVQNAAQVFTDKDSCESDVLRFSLVSELVNTNGMPTLLIRKIPKIKKNLTVLSSPDKNGKYFCTKDEAEYLKNRWSDGHGMLICGANGSGKTTLANALLEETDHRKSAVIMQESEELFCTSHPEMVFRKVIPGKNGSIVSYTLKDLARLALMESFDVMIIGEIKGDEAAELSYATYTGSQVMTTVHSNSAKDGYEKLIDYALDAQPNRSREHFAKQLKSLDTVVFIKDYKVTEILEVKGWDKQTGEYIFEPAKIGVNS